MIKSKAKGAHFSDPISQHLVSPPYSVQTVSTLRSAASRMAAYHIRHLPVLEGQRVAGLLREHDLYVLERFTADQFESWTVGEVMSHDVYFVLPSTPLGTVVEAMRERRYDHAIVLDGPRLAGIFTVTDALHLFGRELALCDAALEPLTRSA